MASVTPGVAQGCMTCPGMGTQWPRLLPNSRLLSYAGWGHAAYFVAGNTCVDDNVTRYLVAGRTPPAGTVCQPEGSPFDAQPATKASTGAVAGVVLPAAVRQALHGN